MDTPEIASPAFFIGKGASGGDLISFGSGQPDLPPPPSAFAVMESFRGFKYGMVQGEENLRAAIAKEYPRSAILFAPIATHVEHNECLVPGGLLMFKQPKKPSW
jgi:aspartate/methionine/tyrosine aminotransferase